MDPIRMAGCESTRKKKKMDLSSQGNCTYGSLFRKNLGIWRAFPIDIQLDSLGDLRHEDGDTAIAALEDHDRVGTVKLFATGSQLRNLAASMQEPFPVLTHLHMRSYREITPVLTEEFLGGSAPRLQEIILDRIPFPTLPTLLLSTTDLVTLNLSNIPMQGYISPERMVACLAALPRLKLFALTYQDIASSPNQLHLPPPTRPVLPALTDFEFQGAFVYLENLVAQIDSPQLEWFSIIYLDQPFDFQAARASDFIDRSIGPPELIPSGHARVFFQFDRVTFTLYRNYNYPGSGWDHSSVATTISHELFYSPRLTDMAQMLSQFSGALCTVVYLELYAEIDESAQLHGAYGIEWLHLLRQFPEMQTLHVSADLAAPVSLALENTTAAEMVAEASPYLGLICLEGGPASSLEKIVSIRRLTDYPIIVVETTDKFNKNMVGRI